ncbi:hypothetical protein, partial [Escherichia coli]|uniref:hypothetical protein n=1 Tax=Escherichia coli TaxID=562 RepID=UPI0017ABFC83
GLTSNGRGMPAGKYSLSLKALDSSGNQLTSTVHNIGTVSDVQLSNGAVLVTVNGNQVEAGKLIRIGGASAGTGTGTGTGTGSSDSGA